MEQTLILATVLLGAAVIAVPLAARLGLGSVLGYLLAGVAIAPIIGAQAAELQHVAEFGVVMMLFLIGLELEPRALWGMRHRLLGLGGLQIGLTTVLLMGVFMWLGEPWQTSLAIGMIFALSSTAIVLQTLDEKGLMQTSGGRSTFSVLLTQDIAVIPMLAFLPLLAFRSPVSINPDGSVTRGIETEDTAHHAMSLVEGLPAWGVTLVTLGAVAAVILVGVFLTNPLFRYIHHARLREMYTALALLIVVSIAALMGLVGLSAALGTFLAGVVLANSEFRHELESDLAPFKGLLLGLFFITVGAGIDFETLLNKPGLIVGLTLAVILIKGFVLYLLAVIFKLRGRARWLFTLGLAQAGEFGFVLIAFSLQQNVLTQSLGADLLLVVALSMLATPLLFILYEVLSRRITSEATDDPEDEIDEKGTVIIAGIGRFGQVVNRLVQSSGFSTVVLDADLKTVQTMRTFGFKGFFGDPTRPDILHAAGLDDASVLVVALDSKEAAVKLVKYARSHNPDLHIVARARDRVHVYELYAAGANDIVRELFDSSLRAGRYVLENLGLSEFEASEAEMSFYHHDRRVLRELAEVWDPKIPIAQNSAYIERAKASNRDLESALAQTLDEAERKASRQSDSPAFSHKPKS
ncbi:Kef-type potassium/proton antiporter, CPA2 family [Octadecabacter temperatus]|uniref:Glutathione-regulated potassium-efflux system protein KefC n=1 Tax=Octadecabacter temperatus TaxID=1458307 RepID=A0A0K0Y3U7_9RHOB|nr:cation:proton antiporter [Octadecabacter temperatus]AKS45609.1 Glutathione-regulated potassium-efflux system protein KefC [Octadecabacter temperatus]SIN96761.1 Kef-type potassium/proton antiporter, CPA2 family [Octadecabacter temperatus]